MTQATHYTRTTGFADDERNNAGGRSTVATADVDFELDAIGQRLNLTIDNLALLQRDDGVMRDGIGAGLGARCGHAQADGRQRHAARRLVNGHGVRRQGHRHPGRQHVHLRVGAHVRGRSLPTWGP
jgi:hypothetical protein